MKQHGLKSFRQKNAMNNNASMTSSGYNYWNKIGNLASTTEQTSLQALRNVAYI